MHSSRENKDIHSTGTLRSLFWIIILNGGQSEGIPRDFSVLLMAWKTQTHSRHSRGRRCVRILRTANSQKAEGPAVYPGFIVNCKICICLFVLFLFCLFIFGFSFILKKKKIISSPVIHFQCVINEYVQSIFTVRLYSFVAVKAVKGNSV